MIGQDLKNIKDNLYVPNVRPLVSLMALQQDLECGTIGFQKNLSKRVINN